MCKFAATWFVSSSLLCAEKRQKEQTKGQIQRLCQTDLAHCFVETGADKARNALWRFSLEFTETVRNNPLLERLSQALDGRFLCFAPISYMAPQNLSKSDPNYHSFQPCRGRKFPVLATLHIRSKKARGRVRATLLTRCQWMSNQGTMEGDGKVLS